MSTEDEMTNTTGTLSPVTLTEWRERMGYSKSQACEELGCSRNAWRGWENGEQGIPRYIGLACAALALGMMPYGELPKKEREQQS